jgi:hypothetical protein
MIGQLPSNMLLTRVRPGIYLSGCALIWSVVSACTAAAHNDTTLFVIRFFLGLTEAPMLPGSVFVLGAWYTRKELALRITILYSGLVLGQACSGLIAAGVFYGLTNVNGLYGWQWLFILEAASGAAVAILAFFVIPDFPTSKTGAGMWFMTEEMRTVATARMQADRVSEPESDHGVWYGVKLACNDYKLYVFVSLDLSSHEKHARLTSTVLLQPLHDLLLRLQLLLPYHRQRSRVRSRTRPISPRRRARLQPHRIADDRTALHLRRSGLLRLCVELRPDQISIVAHHPRAVCFDRGIRCHGRDFEQPCEIFRRVSVHSWLLLGQSAGVHLGCVDVEYDA